MRYLRAMNKTNRPAGRPWPLVASALIFIAVMAAGCKNKPSQATPDSGAALPTSLPTAPPAVAPAAEAPVAEVAAKSTLPASTIFVQGPDAAVMATTSEAGLAISPRIELASAQRCIWRDQNEVWCVSEDSWISIDTAGQTKRGKLPPKKAWFVKKSAEADNAKPWYRLDDYVATQDGQLWLGRCIWGYIGDADPCIDMTYVRIDGGKAVMVSKAPAARDDKAQFAAVKDSALQVSFSAQGPDSQAQTASCQTGGAPAVKLFDDNGANYGDFTSTMLGSGWWIAHGTEFDGSGELSDTPVAYAMQNCAKLGDRAVAGPKGLWAYRGETSWQLMLGTEPVKDISRAFAAIATPNALPFEFSMTFAPTP